MDFFCSPLSPFSQLGIFISNSYQQDLNQSHRAIQKKCFKIFPGNMEEMTLVKLAWIPYEGHNFWKYLRAQKRCDLSFSQPLTCLCPTTLNLPPCYFEISKKGLDDSYTVSRNKQLSLSFHEFLLVVHWQIDQPHLWVEMDVNINNLEIKS